MLTVSLLRHAKSSWSDPATADFDRPLAARGERAAPRMGALMQTRGLVPDLVLCSTARRTRQTLDLVLPGLAHAPAVDWQDALYLASPRTILDAITSCPAAVRHVLVVGHNPGLHALAIDLVGDGPPAAVGDLARKLPTCGLVVIGFRLKRWADVRPQLGRLELFITPGRLEASDA